MISCSPRLEKLLLENTKVLIPRDTMQGNVSRGYGRKSIQDIFHIFIIVFLLKFRNFLEVLKFVLITVKRQSNSCKQLQVNQQLLPHFPLVTAQNNLYITQFSKFSAISIYYLRAALPLEIIFLKSLMCSPENNFFWGGGGGWGLT